LENQGKTSQPVDFEPTRAIPRAGGTDELVDEALHMADLGEAGDEFRPGS
jgi:hypothetical protein